MGDFWFWPQLPKGLKPFGSSLQFPTFAPMKSSLTALLFSFVTITAFAQKTDYAAIDKKAMQIPIDSTWTSNGIASVIQTNFQGDKDRVRAVYSWITGNIRYDVENMFAFDYHSTDAEKISKTLRSKKGICEDYALIFQEVCGKLNIQAYKVTGFTKQRGFTDFIPHAWVVAKVDSSWYVFDPTWGSGYVTKNTFVTERNEAYYMANPEKMIKSHMPFDPMWQLVNYPITAGEFHNGKALANTGIYFNFPDTIATYLKQSHLEQLEACCRRIEQNGLKNGMIFDQVNHLKQEALQIRENEKISLCNNASASYNQAVNLYNELINFRNHQFKPAKPDPKLKEMVDEPKALIADAKRMLESISNPGPNVAPTINTIKHSIETFEPQLEEQAQFVRAYLAKGKMGRPMMFLR